MSYDLLFVRPDKPSRSNFSRYFESRANYELSDDQACYNNSDTGVYFSFELRTQEDLEGLDEDEPEYWASFTLNCIRPRFFAEEALQELEAFVSYFKTEVSDPQTNGMGDGPFEESGFKRGWTEGNRLAVQSLLAQDSVAKPDFRAGADLARIWRWNVGRKALQKRVGDSLFVPRISIYKMADTVLSAALWPDAYRIVLPKTDAILLGKDELAPKRWLRRTPGFSLVPWDEAAPFLAQQRSATEPLEHWFLEHAEPSNELVSWFREAELTSELEMLSMDQVLDAELVP